VLSTEKDSKHKKSTKTFIPGVERKKLKKKVDVSKNSISDEISVIRNGRKPDIFVMKDEEEEKKKQNLNLAMLPNMKLYLRREKGGRTEKVIYITK